MKLIALLLLVLPTLVLAQPAPAKMKWWDACVAYGREYRSHKNEKRAAELFEYLTAEQMLSDLDHVHLGDRTVAIGMTQCGVFASIGIPDATNRTETALSKNSQLIYRSRKLYVYTERQPGARTEIVRTIQD